MSDTVITRFAPSPTGYLHIGGARTALFNWLFAKANNGKMLLRIEDTDRQRSTDEAVDALKDGLTWLGLDWDGEAISQFSRADRHREIAHELIARGAAYKCTTPPEELKAKREEAQAAGLSTRYVSPSRDQDPASIPDDVPYVVRLKAPLEGETMINDKVQGEVTFSNKDLDDFVLLRSDGSPTYMLAVVVDDHDMGVTHIIRGDDHLINAARQKLIFEGMDWPVPVMAHIPLIHGPDGAKLSKRHGAIGAEKYRALGYLPEALRNYLVKLGWAHGDDEIMSTEQMIEWFGFDGMNKAAARFDFAKLDSINAHYIRESNDNQLSELVLALLPEVDGLDTIPINMNAGEKEQFLRSIPALKERAKTLVALAEGAAFIFEKRPIPLEDKAAKLLDADGISIIRDILPDLESIEVWNSEEIATCIRNFTEKREMKLGKVAQPIRAALTGKASSPGAFDVLYILGKEVSLARLKDQIT